MSKTLSDHLAEARAARNADNLRAGMEKARKQRHPEPKPCECNTPDGKHKSSCPVWVREYQRQRRQKETESK